jgi:hypothetical protein
MWGPCDGEVTPTRDTCDGMNRTCSTTPSMDCACTAGDTRPCYTGPADTRGIGLCHDGTETCIATGSTSDWSPTCAFQTTPTLTEICGNMLDDNCNGMVDEGCNGLLACPGNQNVPAGQTLSLVAAGVGLTSFSWSIVSAPAGGASTVVWSPDPPHSAMEQFTPYIVGVYQIRVTAVDAGGHTLTCMFSVTATAHGLRVELTWNGSGDMDLHLHNGTTTRPWYTGADCYYGNCQGSPLPWGAELDFDNTVSNGPENTRVNTPAIGMDYTVAVHNYASAAGRRATVRIFCGSSGSTTPTAMYTSAAFTGRSAGDCTVNQFWRVATIRFTSASACTITPINTYTPSTNACSRF